MSGILGVFSFEEREVFPLIYYGLYALQHRGQGAVGIATIEKEGDINIHKADGLISESFGKGLITHMPGNKGMGFVQYRFSNYPNHHMPVERNGGLLAIDGHIENADFDVDECMRVLNTDFQTIKDYFENITGKFALIYTNNDRFIAFKNQDGVKPLAVGKVDDAIIASSETAAIDSIGGTIIREVQPGEMFIHTKEQIFSYYLTTNIETIENIDAFEFIYTARPDSTIDGISVYEARYRLGETLWNEDKLADAVVIGAPDSGIIPALGYANASGLPYQEGFVRNRYVGRTFIQSTQLERERSIQIKLTPIKRIVANKNIILIDDSIVRGSTITRTVRSLKNAGASTVHVRIAAPPIVHDESVTIDIPDRNELIAYNYSLEEMQKIIGCDSLKYISLDGFRRSIGRNQMYDPYFKY